MNYIKNIYIVINVSEVNIYGSTTNEGSRMFKYV